MGKLAAAGVSLASNSHATKRPPGRVLVVDDEAEMRRSLAKILMSRGFGVLTAEDGEAALALLGASPVDVVLVDLVLPGMDGMDLLAEIRGKHPHVEVVMMTAHASVDAALRAVRAGAYDFLTKPFATPDLVPLVVSKAAERRRLLSLNRDLEQRLEQREQLGEMVGTSPRMREMYRMALGVAPTNTTVLLLGESGTGKELVARAIHKHSSRQSQRFVAVNCGAIPKDLVESELFGHTRGAFTGANTSRRGLFEEADRGTVLLDEVGDLPLQAQVKLLRTLQEGEIKPVGANQTRRVDVRVIAATNVDLKERIRKGTFREDLYYRLNVVAIHLPALRHRKDDIPLLAHHFLRKFAKRVGRDVRRISVEAMRQLRQQEWRGNVRELENCLERAVVLARTDTIMPKDLPFETPFAAAAELADDTSLHTPSGSSFEPGTWSDLPYAEAKDRAMGAFHASYIPQLLDSAGGNISEAARRAGLDRSNFRRVMRRWRGALGGGEKSEESAQGSRGLICVIQKVC